MKKLLFILVLFASSIASVAHATTITNGSFETGDLTGWTGSGALVSPGGTDGDYFATISAGDPTNTITSDLFSADSGNTLSFDWFFQAGDYLPFNDYASYTLLYGASTVSSGVLSDVATVGDFGSSGWMTESILLPSTGDYSISFSSTNYFDDGFSSRLSIDNIVTVPEPGTIFTFLCGLTLLLLTVKPKENKNPRLNAA